MFADPLSFEQLSKHMVNLCVHSKTNSSDAVFKIQEEDLDLPELAEMPLFKNMDYISDLEKVYNTSEISELCSGMVSSTLVGYLFCLAGSHGRPDLPVGDIIDCVTGYVNQWNEYAQRLGFVGPKHKQVTFAMLNDHNDGHKHFVSYTQEIISRI